MAKKNSGLGRGLDAIFLENALSEQNTNDEDRISHIKAFSQLDGQRIFFNTFTLAFKTFFFPGCFLLGGKCRSLTQFAHDLLIFRIFAGKVLKNLQCLLCLPILPVAACQLAQHSYIIRLIIMQYLQSFDRNIYRICFVGGIGKSQKDRRIIQIQSQDFFAFTHSIDRTG